MNQLIKEKANVVRLRGLFEKETDPLVKESMRFRLAEARLWHDVAESGVLEPERIEQVKPKANKRAWQYALDVFIAIGIAVILAVALFGCQTFKGATGDSAWMLQKLSDNINVREK